MHMMIRGGNNSGWGVKKQKDIYIYTVYIYRLTHFNYMHIHQYLIQITYYFTNNSRVERCGK